MRGLSLVLCGLCVALLSSCRADEGNVVEVLGAGECADCKEYNIKTSQAFSGLHVTIDCKLKNGKFKRRGSGELDAEGKFKVSLAKEILKDGKLIEECYVQLHSASATPCPAHEGIEASKIVAKYGTDGKQTFSTAQNIKFSSAICTSAFLWPYFKHPPLPKINPWKKPFTKFFGHPPLPFYPFPKHKHFLPPPIPVYKKPLPPPVPIYKPKPPVFKKPLPPSVPIYKPKPPVFKKPLPPPVPIYKPKPPVFKKPLPPPVPIYKPPVFKKPLPPPVPIYKPIPPVYKPPVYQKPLPPPFPFYKPPFFKKPCPPIPHIPLPKPPPVPKYFFHHPKLGIFPPVPPSSFPLP